MTKPYHMTLYSKPSRLLDRMMAGTKVCVKAMSVATCVDWTDPRTHLRQDCLAARTGKPILRTTDRRSRAPSEMSDGLGVFGKGRRRFAGTRDQDLHLERRPPSKRTPLRTTLLLVLERRKSYEQSRCLHLDSPASLSRHHRRRVRLPSLVVVVAPCWPSSPSLPRLFLSWPSYQPPLRQFRHLLHPQTHSPIPSLRSRFSTTSPSSARSRIGTSRRVSPRQPPSTT